jgi:glucose-1-phosphate cytidylyltransferase
MKAVILAGGLGTRLSEKTIVKPKPMVEIGGKPILWHILKQYSAHGINEFVICCGYKGYVIKEFFANYFLHMSDVTFDLQNNAIKVHHGFAEPWKVTLVDTGDTSMTGGRLKRVRSFIEGDEAFCFTYGDGDGAWINGGYFVLSPKVLDYIADDATVWEKEPMERLAGEGQLSAFRHTGFWQPMDTLRDKMLLEELSRQFSADRHRAPRVDRRRRRDPAGRDDRPPRHGRGGRRRHARRAAAYARDGQPGQSRAPARRRRRPTMCHTIGQFIGVPKEMTYHTRRPAHRQPASSATSRLPKNRPHDVSAPFLLHQP